jgi:hypothetical protein
MLLSDARQTSPLPANAPLPHRSVCPPDLDLGQVPRAAEGRGHQIESSSYLGSGWHPWRRTGAMGRVPGSRLEAPATMSGAASMKDLVWRRIPHRRVRPNFVPALEPRQGSAETAVLERHHFVYKTFFFGQGDLGVEAIPGRGSGSWRPCGLGRASASCASVPAAAAC